jgi:GxxExxY protein
MRTNELTGLIIDAAVEVHRVLGGPGLLESIYEEALAVELSLRGCVVERQVPVPVIYKGVALKSPLRIDLLVNDQVIVECKASAGSSETFKAQTVTYLRLRRRRVSLIINFGKRTVRQHVRRIVDGLPSGESDS